MKTPDAWVEVWRGEDPAIPGRILEAAGIEMRLAAHGWGAHGGGSLLSIFFKRKSQSRLLAPHAEADRARALLKP